MIIRFFLMINKEMVKIIKIRKNHTHLSFYRQIYLFENTKGIKIKKAKACLQILKPKDPICKSLKP